MKFYEFLIHNTGNCLQIFGRIYTVSSEIWKKLWSEELDLVKCKVLGKLKREKKKEIRKRKTEKKTTSEIKDEE